MAAKGSDLQSAFDDGEFVGPVAVTAGMNEVLAVDRDADYGAAFLMVALANSQWSMDAMIYSRTDGVWREQGSSGVVIEGLPMPWIPSSGGWGHGPLLGCAFTRQLAFEGEDDDESWVSADVGFLAPEADHLLCVVEGHERRITVTNPLRAYAAIGRSVTGDFHLIAVDATGAALDEWTAPEP